VRTLDNTIAESSNPLDTDFDEIARSEQPPCFYAASPRQRARAEELTGMEAL
jgi:hypothetical protein